MLDSYFKTGDDGIVFASGNTNANRISSPGLPLTNVLVQNCSISSKSSAIKWEGTTSVAATTPTWPTC